jgi:DNA-binding MarR family transcriptional regulator
MEFRQLCTATIKFHQAIADRLGMNVTDHKCAGILAESGPLTAGDMAERTGLTTGAITGIIDRLEMAGFARRAKDPHDRRRVIIELIPRQLEKRIAPLFQSMAETIAELCAQFSLQELGVIRDFAARARALADEETRKLRAASAAGADARRHRAKKR